MKAPVIKVEMIHIDGPSKGAIQEFFEDFISIGRHPDCHITFPPSLTTISRHHVEIRREGNRFIATDKSTNGTLVNGKPIEEVVLRNGDVLTIAENGPKVSFIATIMQDGTPSHEPPADLSQPDVLPEASAAQAKPGPSPESIVEQVIEPSRSQEKPQPPPQPTPLQAVSTPFIIQFGPVIKSYSALPVTLGSGPDCDFTLSHPAVQPRHAQIFHSENGYSIKDLTDRGLVTINGKPVGTETLLPPDTCIALSPGGPFFQFLGEGRLAEIEASETSPNQESGQTKDGSGKSFWPFKKNR
ncbi:FHA domain-containing protein [Desulfopila sp. IMCC35008]|uniref:FHA domain-containing protein n=1 Tax=Desulfopila sp. IMCC35008 TaxID=2653858 RepID=UPI0013D2D899|nr:FHA domain-containing protein [Desulfopila sp. IMCC35008]